jgi:hypothetical protein
VHKISIYVYIYENRKKKWKKEEEKEFHANWAGGDFGPTSVGERARGQVAQPTHGGAEQREQAPWARAHAPARGGVTALGGGPRR